MTCALKNASALEVSNIFSDHMVLQQQMPVQVWGRAEPGEQVRVRFGSAVVEAQADSEGSWQLSLPPMEASFDPQVLAITAGSDELVFEDVLVGEVWLCSGQSNMNRPLELLQDADIEILAARHPEIRLYQVNHVTAEKPRFSAPGVWQVCSPETVANFSATGYFFGRDIRQAMDVPVGLIQSAWGGTPVIAWTRMEAMDQHPQLVGKLAEWEASLETYEERTEAWKRQQQALEDAGMPDLRPWRTQPMGRDHHHYPSNLAYGMLGPIAPYSIRGVIWYQGESDTGWNPGDYDERLEVMVEDWRQLWGREDLPFGIVQLASYMAPRSEPSNDPWPQLRGAQRELTNRLKNTGLAVTIDLGEANDIHPYNKQGVGRRLARWALADVYDVVELRGGPELVTAKVDQNHAVLTFKATGSGLHIFDGHTLEGFTIAGADEVFFPAEARIVDGETIVVQSENVTEPMWVRYAWQSNPAEANLTNVERHPASPFESRLSK